MITVTEAANRDRLTFGQRPRYNSAAEWQPTEMKFNGVRVWARTQPNGANIHRIGRYGTQFFIGYNGHNYRPNFI